MWVGRGFDTDDDGDNDVFIASKLSPKEAGLMVVGILGVLLVLAVTCGIVVVMEWFGKAQNQQAVVAGASTLWSWVVTVSFYGFFGLLALLAVSLVILGILYGKE